MLVRLFCRGERNKQRNIYHLVRVWGFCVVHHINSQCYSYLARMGVGEIEHNDHITLLVLQLLQASCRS